MISSAKAMVLIKLISPSVIENKSSFEEEFTRMATQIYVTPWRELHNRESNIELGRPAAKATLPLLVVT